MAAALSPTTLALARHLRPEAQPQSRHDLAGRATSLTIDLVDAAIAHGIAPLLYRTLVTAGVLTALTPAVRSRLARVAREAVLLESIQRRDLAAVLPAFDAEGLRPLVVKGAALATTHYEEPWLRPRGDTDLLVPACDADRARGLLERLGGRRTLRPDGRAVTYQASYVREVGRVPVTYDLHWRLADPQVFCDVLTYAELADHAAPAPSVAPGARCPGVVHALLLACVHRAAHHHDSDRLLFLCDIDRLARGCDRAAWQAFSDLAVEKGVGRVCRRALDLAEALLATPIPTAVFQALDNGAADEATAVYVQPALRRVDILRSDLRALPSWRARVGLLREHLFPSRAYLLALYDCQQPALAPLLYVDRIARGVRHWCRPLATASSDGRRRSHRDQAGGVVSTGPR